MWQSQEFSWHLTSWRHILVGWLQWSEERFQRWLALWERLVADESWAEFSLSHDGELYWVLPLLTGDALRESLERQRTRGQGTNDWMYLMHWQIETAIVGTPQHPTWWTDEFDWDAAKAEVEAVLAEYGEKLPDPSETTVYERRLLAGN